MLKEKILFIHSGLREYREALFEELSKKFNVSFAFTYEKNKDLPDARFDRVSFDYEVLKQLPAPIGSEVNPGLVNKVLKKDLDCVIASDSSAFSTHLSFLLAKLSGKKFILFDEQWCWPKTLKYALIFPYVKALIRSADACVVAGTKARAWHESLGVKREKIFLAPNTSVDYGKKKLSLKEIDAEKKRLGLKGKRVVLYFGRVVEYKGLDVLINAFKKAKLKDAALLVVGKGPFLEHCKSLAKKLKVENVVFAPGYLPIEKKALYYSLSDAFVLPSKFMNDQSVNCEAWGLTLNEALSCGTPVISTTAVGGAFDVINDENGFLVKESDEGELSLALKKALSKKFNRVKIRSELLKEFSVERQVEGFERALKYSLE